MENNSKDSNFFGEKENSANVILIVLSLVLFVGICGYILYDFSAKDTSSKSDKEVAFQI